MTRRPVALAGECAGTAQHQSRAGGLSLPSVRRCVSRVLALHASTGSAAGASVGSGCRVAPDGPASFYPDRLWPSTDAPPHRRAIDPRGVA